jgi:hypothetical protein
MSFAYVYCLQSSGTKHLNFLQDNLSRGNMGAVDMLRALFPKPGHLQFLYVDLGDSQAVSIFIMLHFLLNHPQRYMRARIESKGIVACMSENVQTKSLLYSY